MSYEKQTINCSEIDKTIELLKEFGAEYKLTILGEVQGMGCNDDVDIFDGLSRKHKIRKLEYKDKVILEQMCRNPDCDENDLIVSKKFNKDKVPKWKIERTNKYLDEIRK